MILWIFRDQKGFEIYMVKIRVLLVKKGLKGSEKTLFRVSN